MKTQVVVMVFQLLFIGIIRLSFVRFCKKGARHNWRIKDVKVHLGKSAFRVVPVVLTATILFTPASAQILELVFSPDPPKEEPWTPEPSPSIKSVRDVFPESFSLDKVEGSVMLSLADGVYNSKQTNVEAIGRQCSKILLQLEQHRSVQEPFELPDQFELHSVQKSCDYKTADTLDAYDAQLTGFMEEIQTGPVGLLGEMYHRVGITALNALNLCKQLGIEEQETYWYYGELAFWGLVNEYVFVELDDQASVDLFYRIGQAYDYLGTIAKDLPDFRHVMFFLSTSFLRLSCNALESINYSRTGVLYWDDSWHLYLTMLYRLGLYMDAQTELFHALTEYADTISNLNLTTEEKQKLSRLLEKVHKWPI